MSEASAGTSQRVYSKTSNDTEYAGPGDFCVTLCKLFLNVWRGPIEVMKKELRALMPPWYTIFLDFIVESVLELVIDTKHRP